jgi:hypothetical protein
MKKNNNKKNNPEYTVLSEKIEFLNDVQKEILITGPINAFRMEGTFNGVDKILYLFSDFHADENVQVKCHSFEDEMFPNFIYKEMKYNVDKNKEYDIFFEKYKYAIKNEHKRHIDYFEKMYLTMENEKKSNNFFDHVRLHFVDFRNNDLLSGGILNIFYKVKPFPISLYQENMIGHIKYRTKLLLDIKKIIKITKLIFIASNGKLLNKEKLNELRKNVIDGNLKEAISNLNEIKKNLENKSEFSPLMNYITSMINGNFNIIPQFMETLVYFEKITSRIQNDELKKFVDTIFIPHVFEEIEKILLSVRKNEEILIYLEKNINDYGMESNSDIKYKNEYYSKISECGNKTNNLFSDILFFYCLVGMDIYFLMRFLDKKYVKNCIVYEGAMHIVNNIHFLIKYFGFKLTHISNKQENISTEDIIEKVKENDDDISSMYKYLYPPGFKQCIDMSSFPPHFQ